VGNVCKCVAVWYGLVGGLCSGWSAFTSDSVSPHPVQPNKRSPEAAEVWRDDKSVFHVSAAYVHGCTVWDGSTEVNNRI